MAREYEEKSLSNLTQNIYSNTFITTNLQNSTIGAPLIIQPFSYVLNAVLTNGSILRRYQGNGYYWFREIIGENRFRYVSFNVSRVLYSQSGDGSGNGVRCVAKFATDSICPKGWEMARLSGNGSWNNLISREYNKNIVGILANTTRADTGLKTFPLSFLSAGRYYHINGGHDNKGSLGCYWTSRASGINGNYLDFFTTRFYPQHGDFKGYGFSVRCVAKCGDATDSICPKGWEMARHDGDKSFYSLFVRIYPQRNTNVANPNPDSSIMRMPLSLVRNGAYQDMASRHTHGNYFIANVRNLTTPYILRFFNSRLGINDTNFTKGFGISVCCGDKML